MLRTQSLRAVQTSLRTARLVCHAVKSTYTSHATNLRPGRSAGPSVTAGRARVAAIGASPICPGHRQPLAGNHLPLRDYSTGTGEHSSSQDSITADRQDGRGEVTAAVNDDTSPASTGDTPPLPPPADHQQPEGSTVDHGEVEKFAKLANDWWRLDGPFQPLHIMNPVRVSYLRLVLCTHFDLDPMAPRPLQGLRVLDVGCGGGLLSESMARLGANVTGIDAAAEGLAIAQYHAQQDSVTRGIDYRNVTAEDLLQSEGASFDAVLALEVIEHVSDTHQFLSSCASLVKPGGALAVSTINRTPKSFAMAILGAEYILRWVPTGTHEWNRFIKPSELTAGLESVGTHVQEVTGMVYNPVTQKWSMSPDSSVNYIALATRPAGDSSLSASK
eukprot:TRINITY_DN7108_c0_g1_i1.p1 TRINITY_DN7108_c0_g1~~TRINITY_DN7108_c0_g1_i1.p1  ORF type:complete len:388 (+),score=52.46 TRINITY_DN7108_c0_g1_i1:191-1354(+)